MTRHPYDVPDPWPSRVREALQKLVCRVRGHDPMRKYSGTLLCRRCGAGVGSWR